MAEIVLDLKRWGNNLGVRLPAAIAKAAHLHADQRVRITVEGERVIITPLRDEPPTLEQRLARFDPERHGGEAMVAEEALGYLTSITLSGRRQLEWPVGDGFSLGWGFRFYFSFFRAA